MDDLSDYDLDDNFDNYADAHFYDVSLCFNFMDYDDCITFEMRLQRKKNNRSTK